MVDRGWIEVANPVVTFQLFFFENITDAKAVLRSPDKPRTGFCLGQLKNNSIAIRTILKLNPDYALELRNEAVSFDKI